MHKLLSMHNMPEMTTVYAREDNGWLVLVFSDEEGRTNLSADNISMAFFDEPSDAVYELEKKVRRYIGNVDDAMVWLYDTEGKSNFVLIKRQEDGKHRLYTGKVPYGTDLCGTTYDFRQKLFTMTAAAIRQLTSKSKCELEFIEDTLDILVDHKCTLAEFVYLRDQAVAACPPCFVDPEKMLGSLGELRQRLLQGL